ncbi:hypothetical protein Dimus_015133, partial [Dionaea muscipula]
GCTASSSAAQLHAVEEARGGRALNLREESSATASLYANCGVVLRRRQPLLLH